ncbi:MAG: leucine-rich repeat domain-containing protein [Fibrobacteria bacterium]|nr:leucine-rich repeat domain-containing protein [Fibrobacteria bacterium]
MKIFFLQKAELCGSYSTRFNETYALGYRFALMRVVASLILFAFAYANCQTSTRSFQTDLDALKAILDSNGLKNDINMEEVVTTNKEHRIISLNLSNMGISHIPPNIAEIDQLEILTLSRNRLSSLPPEISALSQLKHLDLSRNAVVMLPDSINKLGSLIILNLERNRLMVVPPGVFRLKHLEILNLNHNQISFLPPAIGQLNALQDLFLNFNKLKTLPKEIGLLLKLRNFYLSMNQLESLPSTLFKLSMSIYVNDNALCNLSGSEEQWIYNNVRSYNWNNTQKCGNNAMDITDAVEEPLPIPAQAKKQEILAPPPVDSPINGDSILAMNQSLPKDTQITDTLKILPTLSQTIQDTITLSTPEETTALIVSPSRDPSDLPDTEENITEELEAISEKIVDARTRKSTSKIVLGRFEGFFIEEQGEDTAKDVSINFIFSDEPIMGTTLCDYYDSTKKAIVLDFYDNRLGNSTPGTVTEYPITRTEIKELILDLNEGIEGLEPDIRQVVRIIFYTPFNFPYEIGMDEFNTIAFQFKWNRDIEKRLSYKPTSTMWLIPVSIIMLGAAGSGLLFFF